MAWVAAFLGGTASASGPFVPPGDGAVAFRRDRIPLEVVQIRRLSGDLMSMAESVDGSGPEGRRLVAQCLALSLALEPGNRHARSLLRDWQRGRASRVDDPKHADEALERGLQLLNWLESDEAGADAGCLAACMRDVMSQVGTGDPRYERLRDGAELGNWSNWVPDLDAYRKAPLAVPPVDPTDPNDPPTGKEFTLTLEQAVLTVPMWYPAANQFALDQAQQKWVLKPDRMTMKAVHHGNRNSQPFLLKLGGGEGMSEQMQSFSQSMIGILLQHHGSLPAGLEVEISSNAFEEALKSRKEQSVSAVSVVLASAAVTGREPTGILIGRVDKQGRFRLPSDFWAKLRCFGQGQGQRMVVPAEAGPYMESMLALGKAEYFLEYQVVGADSLAELLDATASDPDPALADACEKFAVIQEKFIEMRQQVKGMNVRTYITNIHVKRRLQEVVNASPRHFSAAMLLAQSMGKRPVKISRQVLASELQASIDLVSLIQPITYDEVIENSYKRVAAGEIHEMCRGKVDALEDFLEREDRELWKQTQDVLSLVREFQRELDRRGSAESKAGPISHSSRELVRQYEALRRDLAKAAED